MTLYLDTSLLVAALTHEPETARMQKWLAAQRAGDLAISEWVATEFSAALSMKVRSRSIEALHRAAANAALMRLIEESFEMLAITTEQFRNAARYSEKSSVGLRAGDALHLAVAADNGATIVTLDRRLAEAATEFAVPVQLL